MFVTEGFCREGKPSLFDGGAQAVRSTFLCTDSAQKTVIGCPFRAGVGGVGLDKTIKRVEFGVQIIHEVYDQRPGFSDVWASRIQIRRDGSK